jgi:hypothetical protein
LKPASEAWQALRHLGIPSPLRERDRVRVAQKLPLILTFSPKGEKERYDASGFPPEPAPAILRRGRE